MKTYKYNPEKIELPDSDGLHPSGFTGEVVLQVPFYQDRLKYIRSMSEDSNDNAVEIFEFTQKHVQSVNVKWAETGEVYNSLDDLGVTEEGVRVINDMGRTLIKGIRLGNPLRPS